MALGASAQEGKSPEEQAAPEQATLPEGIVRPEGTVITPDSDRAPAGFMHTNYKIFVPKGTESPFAEPQNTFAEYPASIGCVYKVGPIYPGCVPTNNGDHPTGGWGAIALVDAYDDPHAAADLAFFDTYFGVPAANFITVYANSSYGTLNGLTASCNGTPQNANAFGWDLEESLDIEWAHTMAPSAEVILVEACSNSDNDLFYAEQVAGIVVASYGGGDISNSWGGGESSAQLATYDNYFYRYHPYHITYFASAGDTGSEVIYPSSSPWVVSAGGTTINRNANGHFLSESCWSGSGGGFSTVEDWTGSGDQGLGPWADYQYVLFGGTPFANPYRSTPDMSFDSDPNSGVWVRDTDPTNGGGWYVVGGTSVASPALAGIVNSAGNKLGQAGPGGGGGWYTPGENNLIYSQLGSAKNYPDNFYDVKTGSNGHSAGAGYDQCTGVGSPRGKAGK
jgi:subtilase family serine protease